MPVSLENTQVLETSESTESLIFTRKLYKVLKVVDGDTIDVEIDGQSQRLRLIGIDTPETVDPRKPIECFGNEASQKMHNLVENKKVALEEDPSQLTSDRYGRLLRYVYLEDGTFVNELMIRDGFAYEYTYDKPYSFQGLFKRAQQFAETNRLGLWAEGVCD